MREITIDRMTYRKAGQFVLVLFAFIFFASSAFTHAVTTAVSMSIDIRFGQLSWLIDNDDDDISDAWENIYFPAQLNVLSDTNDYDGDGVLDGEEFICNTSPVDPDDHLKVTGLTMNPDGTILVTWNSTDFTQPAPRQYSLYYADSLDALSETPQTLSEDIVPSPGNSTSWTNQSAANRFYKVKARLSE